MGLGVEPRWGGRLPLPLPYADGRFSIATCRMLDPLAVLKEMRRVYPPGGRVVVVDMTPVAAHAEAFNAAEKLRDPSHVRAIPVEELFALFERAGLRVARTESYRLDNELEEPLSRSFPEPGDADRLGKLFTPIRLPAILSELSSAVKRTRSVSASR